MKTYLTKMSVRLSAVTKMDSLKTICILLIVLGLNHDRIECKPNLDIEQSQGQSQETDLSDGSELRDLTTEAVIKGKKIKTLKTKDLPQIDPKKKLNPQLQQETGLKDVGALLFSSMSQTDSVLNKAKQDLGKQRKDMTKKNRDMTARNKEQQKKLEAYLAKKGKKEKMNFNMGGMKMDSELPIPDLPSRDELKKGMSGLRKNISFDEIRLLNGDKLVKHKESGKVRKISKDNKLLNHKETVESIKRLKPEDLKSVKSDSGEEVDLQSIAKLGKKINILSSDPNQQLTDDDPLAGSLSVPISAVKQTGKPAQKLNSEDLKKSEENSGGSDGADAGGENKAPNGAPNESEPKDPVESEMKEKLDLGSIKKIKSISGGKLDKNSISQLDQGAKQDIKSVSGNKVKSLDKVLGDVDLKPLGLDIGLKRQDMSSESGQVTEQKPNESEDLEATTECETTTTIRPKPNQISRSKVKTRKQLFGLL